MKHLAFNDPIPLTLGRKIKPAPKISKQAEWPAPVSDFVEWKGGAHGATMQDMVSYSDRNDCDIAPSSSITVNTVVGGVAKIPSYMTGEWETDPYLSLAEKARLAALVVEQAKSMVAMDLVQRVWYEEEVALVLPKSFTRLNEAIYGHGRPLAQGLSAMDRIKHGDSKFGFTIGDDVCDEKGDSLGTVAQFTETQVVVGQLGCYRFIAPDELFHELPF